LAGEVDSAESCANAGAAENKAAEKSTVVKATTTASNWRMGCMSE
jgi:hypothetical protein